MPSQKVIFAHKAKKYKGEVYDSYVASIKLSENESILISIACDSSGGIKKYEGKDRNGNESTLIYANAALFNPRKKRGGLRDRK